ncbi:hypothetical protein MLP_40510 [Microlunatus phosphovorus NM-1]|uniref:Uncharacterized protein n=1 Tax=Microlunatus phosphovorus (strain ATCC 700054 / DSM 10555 / JCM 9379 / NBRC 101784 / NCIMB 13414 / VKM Ac-1990 / NM-1) TaxID=1032480 RepID=F5XR43_MICPN|nr:hypothetical protein MLP_40510 [Microlunatus phosphovorus NM-1]
MQTFSLADAVRLAVCDNAWGGERSSWRLNGEVNTPRNGCTGGANHPRQVETRSLRSGIPRISSTTRTPSGVP